MTVSRSSSQFVFAFLGVLALASTPVNAERTTTEKRGLSSAAGSFDIGEIDTVSLFNGNLTIALPIGQDYPVGPSFSYGLKAIYNSNGWDRKLTTCDTGSPADIAKPDALDNAGFGWSLHLGRLQSAEEGWNYHSPDGSVHRFYQRLHPGFPTTPEANVWYTNNSTYLRLRRLPTGGSACTRPAGAQSECLVLESPDGAVHEFHSFSTSEEDYRLTRQRDAFGNFVDVSYPNDGTTWELVDQHGRTQTLTFGGPAGSYDRVNRVELSAFGGATATYTLRYTRTQIDRQGFAPVHCSGQPSRVWAQLLTQIELPDGSWYDFEYNTTDGSPEILSGGMKRLRLPTGGEMAWTYQAISLPSQDPERMVWPLLTVAYGVATKTTALSSGGAIEGTWTYDFDKSPDRIPGDEVVPCHRVTIVTDPLDNVTKSFFTSSFTGHRWSFGLPFTRCEPGVGYAPTAEVFLSSQTLNAAGTLLRSNWVRYGSDGNSAGNGDTNQDKNHRLEIRRTLYHDDLDSAGQPRFKEERFSDFDGLGNFRTHELSGNLGGATRTTTVDFNASAGTLIVDPETGSTVGSTFVLPASNDAWLLQTFTEQRITESGATAIVENCFDSDTGFLEKRRVLAGATRSNADLFTHFLEEGTTGQVSSERLFGGDDHGLTFASDYTTLCDMSPILGEPMYRTDHTYAHGVRASTTRVDPCDGTEILSELDVDIDASTGLVATRRDPAGVATSFEYDPRGRMVTEERTFDAWTSFDYQLPTLSSPTRTPQVVVRDCVNGSATCNIANSLTWSRLRLDGLGRTVEESIRIPEVSGVNVKNRTFTLNALGWPLTESVWGSTSQRTTFGAYDPFGRAGSITLPDGSITRFTFIGDRVRTRESSIQLETGATSVFTTELSDTHGRLVEVCEDRRAAWTGSCSGGLLTSYNYDVLGDLSRVCLKDTGTGCGQTRLFTRDHRGFVTEEQHPEIGVSGNGRTQFFYDAAGNLLRKNVVGSTEFDLRFRYDKAGRLIRVFETNDGNLRLLKELFYGLKNVGTDLRKGQLVQAKRHNWVDLVAPLAVNPGSLDAIITEVFKYEGRSGRVSARQTRYHFGGTTYAWNTGFSWDALGNLSDLEYPECQHSTGGCPSAAPPRTLRFQHTKGLLTSVDGYATLSYQSGGMVHKVSHANGVVTTLGLHSSGMQRPGSIASTSGWSTGTYSYDGVGNVRSIGTQAYAYDGRRQLKHGSTVAGSGLETQTATYDDFGNLTRLTTSGSARSLPTSTSTNRLFAPLAKYDPAGNLVELTNDGELYRYTYDSSNKLKHLQSNTDLARIFLYNAQDERIAQFDCVTGVCETQGSKETWTLRDLDGNVLRIYEHPWSEGFQWKEDYVHRDGQILAIETPEGRRTMVLDHLGTPRQATDSLGAVVETMAYAPFGADLGTPSAVARKFTGHERDANGVGGGGDLDYMQARFYSLGAGKILFDRSGRRQRLERAAELESLRLWPEQSGEIC